MAESSGIIQITDKRGQRRASLADNGERQPKTVALSEAEQLRLKRAWTEQAAGTLWWSAQGAAERGEGVLAGRILDNRETLIANAVKAGVM